MADKNKPTTFRGVELQPWSTAPKTGTVAIKTHILNEAFESGGADGAFITPEEFLEETEVGQLVKELVPEATGAWVESVTADYGEDVVAVEQFTFVEKPYLRKEYDYTKADDVRQMLRDNKLDDNLILFDVFLDHFRGAHPMSSAQIDEAYNIAREHNIPTEAVSKVLSLVRKVKS